MFLGFRVLGLRGLGHRFFLVEDFGRRIGELGLLDFRAEGLGLLVISAQEPGLMS